MPAHQLQSIFVRSHQQRTQPDQHVAYQVETHDVSGRSWSVWRRYSEFVELDAELAKEAAVPVSLPPKQRSWIHPWSRAASTDEAYLAERSNGLERYLRTLLSHRDGRWRDARAFADFLAAPITSASAPRDPGGFTSSSWLDEQEQLVALARDARADLSRRDTMQAKGDVNARQVSVDAKKKLATLVSRMTALTKGLDGLAMGGMAEGELRRRSDMVSRLQVRSRRLALLGARS
jgi:regulator of vacuolar morphogenesis